jgi:hypothetical protein
MSCSSSYNRKLALSPWAIFTQTVAVMMITCNLGVLFNLQPYAFAQLPGNQDTSKAITPATPTSPLSDSSHSLANSGKDVFTIDLKIRGIDYSDKMAQVWVTVNNQTVAYNINPIALLDPEDDGDGIIHVPVTFPHGVVKPGDEYTACIKIVVHSDNFGNTYSCQKGIISAPTSSTSIVTSATSNQTEQEPYTLSLFL